MSLQADPDQLPHFSQFANFTEFPQPNLATKYPPQYYSPTTELSFVRSALWSKIGRYQGSRLDCNFVLGSRFNRSAGNDQGLHRQISQRIVLRVFKGTIQDSIDQGMAIASYLQAIAAT